MAINTQPVYSRLILLILIFLMVLPNCRAQEISFKDTIATYNKNRLHTNRTGMQVLCTWGIANIADGGIGYFAAKQDEWKYFHEMNAVWGAANFTIASLRLGHGRYELSEKLNYRQSYSRYKADKKRYLINSGIDVLFISAGLALTKYNAPTKTGQAMYNGFGKSIVLQAGFLFIFDNFMYTSHARMSSKWYRIMDEISVSANGIGIKHTFK